MRERELNCPQGVSGNRGDFSRQSNSPSAGFRACVQINALPPVAVYESTHTGEHVWRRDETHKQKHTQTGLKIQETQTPTRKGKLKALCLLMSLSLRHKREFYLTRDTQKFNPCQTQTYTKLWWSIMSLKRRAQAGQYSHKEGDKWPFPLKPPIYTEVRTLHYHQAKPSIKHPFTASHIQQLFTG